MNSSDDGITNKYIPDGEMLTVYLHRHQQCFPCQAQAVWWCPVHQGPSQLDQQALPQGKIYSIRLTNTLPSNSLGTIRATVSTTTHLFFHQLHQPAHPSTLPPTHPLTHYPVLLPRQPLGNRSPIQGRQDRSHHQARQERQQARQGHPDQHLQGVNLRP